MNYRQKQTSAKTWTRATSISISNPIDGTPTISFMEQDVVEMDGKTRPLPGMPSQVYAVFDPAGVIPLVDPETGLSLGSTLSHQALYVALHSLYRALAAARDATPPADDPRRPEPPLLAPTATEGETPVAPTE
jgi:hypothetical protein